jgi:hypothetical protein
MSKALVCDAKAVDGSTLKRANVQRGQINPALKALVYEPFGQAV